MEKYIIVSIGAAIGGAFRYWLSGVVSFMIPVIFPYGTLAVNFLGSLLLGLLIFWFDEKGLLSPAMKLFTTIGFCGGFTTFSTFTFETFNLIRDSEFYFALLNVFLNVIICLAGITLSYFLSKVV